MHVKSNSGPPRFDASEVAQGFGSARSENFRMRFSAEKSKHYFISAHFEYIAHKTEQQPKTIFFFNSVALEPTISKNVQMTLDYPKCLKEFHETKPRSKVVHGFPKGIFYRNVSNHHKLFSDLRMLFGA